MPLRTRKVADVTRSNVAVTPRSSYSTFRHVAVTPRFHVLDAQKDVISAAIWRHGHVSGFALQTARFVGVTCLSTSDFQSEVGEVFGKIGGELPAKLGRRFSSFFCWGKS